MQNNMERKDKPLAMDIKEETDQPENRYLSKKL